MPALPEPTIGRPRGRRPGALAVEQASDLLRPQLLAQHVSAEIQVSPFEIEPQAAAVLTPSLKPVGHAFSLTNPQIAHALAAIEAVDLRLDAPQPLAQPIGTGYRRAHG